MAENDPTPGDIGGEAGTGTPSAEPSPSGDGGDSGGDGRDWLPESFRDNPNFQNVESPAILAERYDELKRLQGGSIRLPGKDTTPEQRAEFFQKFKEFGEVTLLNPEDKDAMSDLYSKLGRPESAEEYSFDEVEFPEGAELQTAVHDRLRSVAHEAGLSAGQYKALANEFNQMQVEAAKAQVEQKNATLDALKSSWGDAYESRMGAVQQFLNEMVPEDKQLAFADELERAGLANSPLFGEALFNMAKRFGEPGMLAGDRGSPSASTLDELQAQLSEVQANPAYFNSDAANHDSLVRKASDLNQRILDTERRLRSSAA